MRDRLIELIQNSVGGCARHWAQIIADHLLANGIIVPPCKVGDTLYVISQMKDRGRYRLQQRRVGRNHRLLRLDGRGTRG